MLHLKLKLLSSQTWKVKVFNIQLFAVHFNSIRQVFSYLKESLIPISDMRGCTLPCNRKETINKTKKKSIILLYC